MRRIIFWVSGMAAVVAIWACGGGAGEGAILAAFHAKPARCVMRGTLSTVAGCYSHTGYVYGADSGNVMPACKEAGQQVIDAAKGLCNTPDPNSLFLVQIDEHEYLFPPPVTTASKPGLAVSNKTVALTATADSADKAKIWAAEHPDLMRAWSEDVQRWTAKNNAPRVISADDERAVAQQQAANFDQWSANLPTNVGYYLWEGSAAAPKDGAGLTKVPQVTETADVKQTAVK